MFEDEIKMEEKSSNVVPLLAALGLVIAIGATLTYFIMESKRTVSEAEALQAATEALKAQGPVTVHFEVGQIGRGTPEDPFGPHYKILQKIGVLKPAKPTAKGIDSALTPDGKKLLEQCGATPEKGSDGTDAYTVPLAQRKLIKITKIEMPHPGRANIEFQWNWEPTPMGQYFDVGSPQFASMSLYERSVLIEKYGADYYKDSKVKTRSLALIWDDKGKVWKPLNE